MPELPEVEALTRYLLAEAEGAEIARVDVAAISALKTYDPPVDALKGRRFTAASRRGKHLELQFGDLWLVIHLARGGWVRLIANVRATPVKPGKGPLALRVVFTDGTGFDVTEAGTEKRLAVWVARDPLDIENVATLGPDPLDESFTSDVLAKLLASAGKTQIKKALTDQRLIAGVGNAYSDEALHVAKLSPFKPGSSLTDDDVVRLHAALVGVLRDAVVRSVGLVATDLKREKKEGMRVHGRTGQPCPECGDTVREVSFSSKSLQYCPTCQTGGKPLADRRTSKFLK